MDAIVRTFASVSFALKYLSATGTPNRVVDQFWTNVGYFNSLKDLGSADTLILDRVCAYAESLRQHKFRKEAERVGMTEKFQDFRLRMALDREILNLGGYYYGKHIFEE